MGIKLDAKHTMANLIFFSATKYKLIAKIKKIPSYLDATHNTPAEKSAAFQAVEPFPLIISPAIYKTLIDKDK